MEGKVKCTTRFMELGGLCCHVGLKVKGLNIQNEARKQNKAFQYVTIFINALGAQNTKNMGEAATFGAKEVDNRAWAASQFG